MASTPVMFLLFLMLFAKEATAEKIIQLGSSLSPKGNHSSWASSSGHFAFGFYQQGNSGFGVGIWLVTPPENTIVWTANRDSSPVSSNSSLDLTKDGRLLLRNGKEDHDLISTAISDYSRSLPYVSKPIASASMNDSGNFVLYDEKSVVIWQSFDDPTDTILGGQYLTSGDSLVSSMSKLDHSRGSFYLSMQYDGNLVAYPASRIQDPQDTYWASQTQFEGSHLSLNDEGSLCVTGYVRDLLCLTDSIPRNKSQNSTSIYRTTLDVDGNLRLYEHQFEGNTSSTVKMLWQALPDQCQIPGFCGLNSYCSNMSGNAVCECCPGFVPSKRSGNVSLDCVQNHSKDDCESVEDPTMLYNVTQLDNMYWGDTPYSVITVKMETCKKSCQQDCNCGAVLYSNGNCKKYRLPLVYTRRIQNSSTVGVALLKMLSGFSPIQPSPTKAKPKPKIVIVVDDNKTSLIMILAFTLGSISLFCLGFAVSIFFTYRRKVYMYKTLSASENLGFTEDCSLRLFSFDELVKSTGGFTEEVGRGSFGAVYKGTIGDSNRSIAVKRLEKIVDEGEREFRAEITAIARTHHRNLVKLIGFCIDGSRKLLVYEYVSNGSLAKLLFNGEKHLSWGEKLKIAMDVARGVLYLHEECEVRIIHCNIKPRNILMDEAWTAKISDFGLARLKQDNSAGDETSRYLAPEWQKDASVSVKTDIYSFGVVLLEIVCRRSSIDMNVSSPEKILLSSWVYQCFAAGQLNRLVTDEDDVDWKMLERMVKVGLWCVQDHPSLRPSMKNVILMLEGLKDIPIPPSAALLVK
ncbi:G-type lectin S-receptor-like serine/threonine-protein kinase LECRK2 [Gastrolobium bilobum]|uniref:G-type lectin S-receptor-like serine/threonine-protein kinase LECRK2 n=1 Tax=Gastrolobium bilobum TaxID=150636 RepID=UPI002AB1230A|nr:G-type lectin S-receptor-like serine/threonine-protein kinase LECRK2 [Gastrolobium bilobum]